MKKPDARSRILAKAASLFLRRGYSEVGINEIIQESETAKATFYHHFPSKQALCQAWLSEIHQRSAEQRRALLESDQDPVTKLETYFQYLADYMREHEFRGCPYSNTAAVTHGEGSLLSQIREHKAEVREFFRQWAREISLTEKRANRLGDAVFLLYSGAATEAQNLRETWPVEAACGAALELFRHETTS